MNRRRTAVAALALFALSGCSSQRAAEADAEPAASRDDGVRQAVDGYLTALNARSATSLIRIGGVEDEAWSRREAAKILAAKGGRGWKISDLDVEHDMGPDTGSARLAATDEAGRPMTGHLHGDPEQGDVAPRGLLRAAPPFREDPGVDRAADQLPVGHGTRGARRPRWGDVRATEEAIVRRPGQES